MGIAFSRSASGGFLWIPLFVSARFGASASIASAQFCGCTGNIETCCTAGTSVQGCVPSISGLGVANVLANPGFELVVSNVPGQRSGTTTEFSVGSSLLCGRANSARSNHSNSNFVPAGQTSTIDVGRFAPKAWALHEMSGNVWEWCLVSFSACSAGAVTDPFTTGGSARRIRGGGWDELSSKCRSASRCGNPSASASYSTLPGPPRTGSLPLTERSPTRGRAPEARPHSTSTLVPRMASPGQVPRGRGPGLAGAAADPLGQRTGFHVMYWHSTLSKEQTVLTRWAAEVRRAGVVGITVAGCVPSISGFGVPSASGATGFEIVVSNVPAQHFGLIFHGLAPIPGGQAWWVGSSSMLCIAPPYARGPLQDSGGIPDTCTGELHFEFDPFIANNPPRSARPSTPAS